MLVTLLGRSTTVRGKEQKSNRGGYCVSDAARLQIPWRVCLPQECGWSGSTGDFDNGCRRARGREDDDAKTAILVRYRSGLVGWIAECLRARGERRRGWCGNAAPVPPVAWRERR